MQSRRRYLRNLGIFAAAALCAGLMIGLGGLCWVYAEGLAFPQRAPTSATPADSGISTWQTITLTTSDGLRLDGWYIPPSAPQPGPALVFVHGHGGNRAQFLRELALIAPEGYGALLFDLRNHGTSEGTTTAMGLLEVEDVIAAFDFLRDQPEVHPDQIGIYGASMGGAASLLAMARLPQARVLITESAYASFPDLVADGIRAVSGLPRFPFGDLIIGLTGLHSGQNLYTLQPIQALPHIAPRPVLILHGTADLTVPVSHAHRLYAAASEPKALFIVAGGGHINLVNVDTDAYTRQVIDFLNTYLRGS